MRDDGAAKLRFKLKKRAKSEVSRRVTFRIILNSRAQADQAAAGTKNVHNSIR